MNVDPQERSPLVKLTRSERQQGKPSAPVELQRARILAMLAQGRGSASMSVMAYAAFPDYKFRSPQGAALAVSRTVRGMYDDKLLTGVSIGYQITAAGLKQASLDAKHGVSAQQSE